jgi:uncharacterized RDD family membrane protein YckC
VNAYQVPADPTAVMGRRLGAWIIDLVILYGILVGLAIANGESSTLDSATEAQAVCDLVNDAGEDVLCINAGSTVYLFEAEDILLSAGLALLAAFLNGVVLQGVTGGTIGKLLIGVRVVRRDTGAVCGVGKAFVRWILWIVDGIGCGVPLVGPITALATKGHRRLGDMAAGTLVVGKEAVGRPPFVPGLDGPAVSPMPWGAPVPAAGPGWATTPPPPAATGWGAPPAPPAGPPASAPAAPPAAPPAAEPGWSTGTPPGSDWSSPAPSAGEPAPQAPAEPGGWTTATPPATDWTTPAPPSTPAAGWSAPGAAATAEPTAPPPAAEPTAPAPAPAPEPAAPVAQPGVDAPMWDEARGTYIQWDPKLQQWMQWDDTTKRWEPIV